MNELIELQLDSTRTGGLDPWAGRASSAIAVISCDARTLRTEARHEAWPAPRRWDDPLAALAWMADYVRDQPHDGHAAARWVGYLGYDLGRLFEDLPSAAAADLRLPLFRFALVRPRTSPLDSSPPTPSSDRLEAAVGDRPTSTFTRSAYERAVLRCVQYIAAGDVFQVNLSQRYAVPSSLPPRRIYERLRADGGAHYGALLHFDGFAVISHSPELFLRVSPPDALSGKRRVVTRPIKGTRPLSAGMDAELRDSAKDQAELNMIVDLERNDLGRVCEVGSVRVTGPRTIEAHPTVYHGVATVEGVLRNDVTFVDLLRATFPGGSVTGAPKIRAMQIIEELEPVRRGPYCGAIGYLAADGSIQFNVAIRTMVVKDGLVHVPVGGGIVADSDPAAEYEETLVKARAMFAALGLSVDDLRDCD